MQSASTVLRPDSHCPNPSILIDFRRSPKLKPLSLPQRGKPYRKLCSLTNNRSTQQSSLSQSNRVGSRSSPHRPQLLLNVGRILLFRWTYRVRLPKPGRGGANIDEFELGVHTELFTHMWWPELRSSFGKRINFEGIVSAARVLLRDQHLALPHMAAPDIRYIDWVGLRKHGFKDVVFDKDNMITLPYSLALWAPLGSSMEECKSVFRKDIAVFSNSAGHLKGTLESKSLGIE
ncbi:unnamed protein product [Linum trigynum]|uniref:Uncharacterized protein n=1 Tax=Linum trigynum TaxID=586398 RepID=A0AAV2EUK6_9ROSI